MRIIDDWSLRIKADSTNGRFIVVGKEDHPDKLYVINSGVQQEGMVIIDTEDFEEKVYCYVKKILKDGGFI